MKQRRARPPVPPQTAARADRAAYLRALAWQCGGTLKALDPETPIFLSRKQRAATDHPKIPRAMSRQQAYAVLQALYAEAQVSRHDGKALANHTLRKTFAIRIY